jgi:integrase
MKSGALTFVRPIELRTAQWNHFDLKRAEWRTYRAMMKKRIQHIVPLSKRALALLGELKEITGDGLYLFPALGNPSSTLPENTINRALRRMGYGHDDLVGHGFRSMASTLLNEHGWTPDAIERQLSHIEESETRRAYNYAEYLAERRLMMQGWADLLDDLRANKTERSSQSRHSPQDFKPLPVTRLPPSKLPFDSTAECPAEPPNH